MKFKNLVAGLSAISLMCASMPLNDGILQKQASILANAGEIPYTANSSLTTGDYGNMVRRNIYNVWGNNVVDINPETPVYDYITVNFTISGIGTDSSKTEGGTRYDLEGSTDYIAFIGGSIAGLSQHSVSGTDTTEEYVHITGDGTYEVTWTLDMMSKNINCLYLQTNINYLDYLSDEQKEEELSKKLYDKNPELSGIEININSITTGENSEETTMENATEVPEETTEAREDTTKEGGGFDYDCINYEYLDNNSLMVRSYDASIKSEIVIPDEIYGRPVVAIYGFPVVDAVTYDLPAFFGCDKLVSVIVGENVTDILTSAFASCTNLTSVTIGSNVKNIYNYVFAKCPNLKEITILNADCNIASSTFGDDENFNGTIYGYANSTAQDFAEKHGYNFELIGDASTPSKTSEPVEPAEGMTWNNVNPDINRDGKIDASDGALLLAYAADFGAGKVKDFSEFMDNRYPNN